jgi:cytochrome c peroxidase
MSWWGGAALSLVLTASVACGRNQVEQQRTPPPALTESPAPPKAQPAAAFRQEATAAQPPLRAVLERQESSVVTRKPDPAGFQWRLPRGLPVPRVPADNPMSDAKVALGRSLFHDRRLSGNGQFACASCHQQRKAFTDGRAQAIGSTGGRHARGTMSLTNVAYNASFGWADESLTTLETQMTVPLFNEHPIEMGLRGRQDEVVARFASSREDAERFRAIFPGERPVTLENIVKAVAAFQRTLISGDSPVDRYLYRDDRAALSEEARRGLQLYFSDRLRCALCHGGFNLSGPLVSEGSPPAAPVFHNTGLVDTESASTTVDRGLFEKTKNPADRGRFRAPTLRNIAVTAPYMHDGSIATLEDVIAHYAAGGKPGTSPSRMMRPFTLTAAEVADLVAFLNSLTDERFLKNPAFSDPAAPVAR